MANWYGTARSNYVRIKNRAGLEKALEPFGLEIGSGDGKNAGKVFFTVGQDSDSGGWPASGWLREGDGDNTEVEIDFDPAVHICPFLRKGEVLVMVEAGAEKLRYITGHASAYNWEGSCVHLDLGSIYSQAASAFGVKRDKITLAEY